MPNLPNLPNLPSLPDIPLVTPETRQIIRHPGKFAWQVIRAFRANQGMLLAGAVAYYTLLSLVPMLILLVVGLSHVVPQAELLSTLGRALEWVAPGQSKALVKELAGFLEHNAALGWVLFGTMLFFSSLAFSVLESAISVIFFHRVKVQKRRFIFSALLPFGYIAFIAFALLAGTLVLTDMVAISESSLRIFGNSWSLGPVTRVFLYVAGVFLECVMIGSIYYFMPVGRLSLRHALIGGVAAGLLWEIVRHLLVWYLSHVSRVDVVYGSLTTAIVVLLSFELAATLLLLGAQVIAEYERIGEEPPQDALKTPEVANAMAAAVPAKKARRRKRRVKL